MDAIKTPVNIKRVAQEAGVSTMTISRVMNDPSSVAPETRQRVQEAIHRLGYRPNAIARSLKSKRTHNLGLITVDFIDSFFTQVSAGAEAEARQHGYRIIISSTEHNLRNEYEYVRLLAEQRVDGILLVRDSILMENDPIHSLPDPGVPIITTGYKSPDVSLSTVDIDNVDGAYKATQFLLENGHRCIAMIAGPNGYKAAQDRSRGYQMALQEAGVSYDPDLIINGDSWRSHDGLGAMRLLLEKGKPFSAVFTQSDELAFGAIRAMRQAGLHIPQDVSVIGYDDIAVTEYYDPPLTTMRQAIREVGIQAARMLIQQIEDPEQPCGDIILKTELVRRASVLQRES